MKRCWAGEDTVVTSATAGTKRPLLTVFVKSSIAEEFGPAPVVLIATCAFTCKLSVKANATIVAEYKIFLFMVLSVYDLLLL